MRMDETYQRSGLLAKALYIILCQMSMEQFNSSGAVKIYLPTEIDICKTTTSQVLYQAIIAYLLTHAVTHKSISL